MLPDDPGELIAGKNYGQEGTAQRLLAALIIAGREYGYNRSWIPSGRGTQFARGLSETAFGSPPQDTPRFVNEFDLLATAGTDKQAVDYAWLWPRHLLLVELKTDRSAHQPGQLRGYLERATHHHPDSRVDLLYLTPPMAVAAPDYIPPNSRYAHLSWPEVVPIADAIWGASEDPAERRCLSLLRDHLQIVGALAALPPPSRRREAPDESLPPEWDDVLKSALDQARAAAAGQRVAVDVPIDLAAAKDFPQRLEQLRSALRRELAARADTGTSRVGVWQWTAKSGGSAHTAAGQQCGAELRLSPPPTPRTAGR